MQDMSNNLKMVFIYALFIDNVIIQTIGSVALELRQISGIQNHFKVYFPIAILKKNFQQQLCNLLS